MNRFTQFLIDDGAQALVEYALIISLVSVAALGGLRSLGEKAGTTFLDAADQLQ